MPPYITTNEEIDRLVQAMGEVLEHFFRNGEDKL